MTRATRYSPEVRERAVRMLFEHEREYNSQWSAIVSIASKIGCTPETLRKWVRRTEVDTGLRGGLGVGQEAKGALLKLAAALPAARRDIEQRVRNRIHLDPQSWRPRSDSTPTLSLLREGVWSDRWMAVTFQRMRRIHTSREIAPYGLVAKETRWYIIWSGRDGRMHVDRASAVAEAELLDERFERPDTFDLAIYWSQWATKRESNCPAFAVTVLAQAEVIPFFERELGAERVLRSAKPQPDGRVPIELTFEYFEQARSMLLGFGGAMEVVAPEALRRSMADFGERICSTYRDS